MAHFNLNKVILGGRLTADPELKTTQSGISVTSFTIAVNRPRTKEGTQSTDFINATAWRGTAEFITRYFRKASSICITGSLQVRTYEKDGVKKYITEVVADEAFFVDSKDDMPIQVNAPVAQVQAQPTYIPEQYTLNSAPRFEEIKDDEELPF